MAGKELNNISPSEKIGRRVFDSKDEKAARHAERPWVRRKLFKPKSGNKVSTDRLDHASYERMIEIVKKTDLSRGDRFKGWVFLVVGEASKDGRNVIYSPTHENPYHVDIELPDPVTDNKEDEIDHAQALADIAKWYYPSNNADTLTLDEESDTRGGSD